MSLITRVAGPLFASLFILLSSLAPAHAIQCKGPYQVIKGHGALATPYCQDNYLGEVAREHGIKVSNKEIRQNPIKKAEVCRYVGHDNRVSFICKQSRGDIYRSNASF